MIKTNNNKTKIMGLMLVLCLVLSLAACGGKEADESYDYDLSEYVTLGDYTGIKVTESAISVSAEEIQAEIQTRLQAASTTTEKKEGIAELGQTVNISYVGKIDGVAFKGGSTEEEGADIPLGSSGYIEGFDEGVIGMEVGETKDLNLQFPEVYEMNPELAGKPTVFTVTLNSISVSDVPEYDLEFIKANSEYTTVKEYESSVKKDLLATKEAAAEEEMSNSVWTTVMGNAKILKYPEAEIQTCKDINKKYYEDYAAQYDMEFADFVKQYTDMTEEEYETYLQEYSEAIVAQEMVMYSIARKEDITISDSEYDKRLKEYMTEQGITSDEDFKAQYGASFEEYVGKENLIKSFMLEKVLDFVTEKSVKVPAEETAQA